MYSHYAVAVSARTVSDQTFQRLLEIIAVNSSLLKQALGVETLAIVYIRGRLWFPWFTVQGAAEEIEVYHDLVASLCDLAEDPAYDPVRGYGTRPGRRTVLRFLSELGFSKDRRRTAFLLRNFPWWKFLVCRLIPAFDRG